MARGYPDYGNPSYQVASRQIDLGALVIAGLRVNTIDNRGRMIYATVFDELATDWRYATLPVRSYPHLTTAWSGHGNMSLVLPCSGGAGIYDNTLYKRLNVAVPNRLGYEIGFRQYGSTPWIRMVIMWGNTTAKYFCEIDIKGTTGQLFIWTPDYSVLLPYTIPSYTSDQLVCIKMVVDFTTGRYVRLVVGQTEYDLSMYDLNVSEASLNNPIVYMLDVSAIGSTAEYAYISHVILTTDEP